jgi:hypothetical protein
MRISVKVQTQQRGSRRALKPGVPPYFLAFCNFLRYSLKHGYDRMQGYCHGQVAGINRTYFFDGGRFLFDRLRLDRQGSRESGRQDRAED